MKSDEIKRVLAHAFSKDNTLLSSAADYILDLEADLAYYRCIFDGSWSQGKEILEQALLKYKEK